MIDLEPIIDQVLRVQADDSHMDLCDCDDWPQGCVSGFTRAQFERGDEGYIIGLAYPFIEKALRGE